MITQQQMIDLFDYRDGKLFWRSVCGRAKLGSPAGYINPHGYTTIRVNYSNYGAHRLIFLRQNGWLPQIVDHIDGDRTNNKIENLRAATKAQNSANVKRSSRNTSGHKNVSWSSKYKVWRVVIQLNGRSKFIGSFNDLDLAVFVASEYRDKYHGEFARHG